jgi:hypothetical protein
VQSTDGNASDYFNELAREDPDPTLFTAKKNLSSESEGRKAIDLNLSSLEPKS